MTRLPLTCMKARAPVYLEVPVDHVVRIPVTDSYRLPPAPIVTRKWPSGDCRYCPEDRTPLALRMLGGGVVAAGADMPAAASAPATPGTSSATRRSLRPRGRWVMAVRARRIAIRPFLYPESPLSCANSY